MDEAKEQVLYNSLDYSPRTPQFSLDKGFSMAWKHYKQISENVSPTPGPGKYNNKITNWTQGVSFGFSKKEILEPIRKTDLRQFYFDNGKNDRTRFFGPSFGKIERNLEGNSTVTTETIGPGHYRYKMDSLLPKSANCFFTQANSVREKLSETQDSESFFWKPKPSILLNTNFQKFSNTKRFLADDQIFQPIKKGTIEKGIILRNRRNISNQSQNTKIWKLLENKKKLEKTIKLTQEMKKSIFL